jgi:hypothetical protein
MTPHAIQVRVGRLVVEGDDRADRAQIEAAIQRAVAQQFGALHFDAERLGALHGHSAAGPFRTADHIGAAVAQRVVAAVGAASATNAANAANAPGAAR